ncbi:hypothetical protein NDU88_004073 [Pleurodeles waltl]|uniref:Uncharacterized protein n=1 Tax=Pleurodeles waltl TaxID=8319 RepID=A0AAV7MTU5_PLEWA|nr:hypothetical protein NDU88_004073 [Pleurodeles waltl]
MVHRVVGAVSPLNGSADSEQGNERTFACPLNFIPCPFTAIPSFTREKLNSSDTEFWLIKAPLDFNPASFIGKNIPLIGFKSVKNKNDGKKQIYNIFSSPRKTCSSQVLVPKEDHNQLLSGPSFHGYINICDSFRDPRGGLHPVSSTPIRKIPEGLKQRFLPFGATTATTTTGGLGVGGAQITDCKIIWPDGGKSKKKRKKHAKVEEVLNRLLCVKQEAMDGEGAWGNLPGMDQDSRGSCLTSKGLPIAETTMKKRKKRNREKEHEEASATALESEDNVEDEAFLSVIKEEAITEPSEGNSNKSGRIQNRKKKRLFQENLEELFSPTATELGSVFKKKK